jgi:hypothetical protein
MYCDELNDAQPVNVNVKDKLPILLGGIIQTLACFAQLVFSEEYGLGHGDFYSAECKRKC